MNPILLLYLLLIAFVIWVLLAWLFPKIGDFIKTVLTDVKDIIGQEDEEDE